MHPQTTPQHTTRRTTAVPPPRHRHRQRHTTTVRAGGTIEAPGLPAVRLAPQAVYQPSRHGVYAPYAKQVRAVLERFTEGLVDAGHESEVVDLHAIRFNPVFTRDDYSFFVHESVPQELLSEDELRVNMVAASGGAIRRRLAERRRRTK